MKNILVTGGCGFIGHELTQQLSKYNKVYVLDLKSKIKNYKNTKNIKYINCNISKKEQFRKINFKIDYIYHLAAQTSSQIGEERPMLNKLSNVIGTKNICDLAIRKKIKCIFFTSSMAVYGNECSKKKEIQIF